MAEKVPPKKQGTRRDSQIFRVATVILLLTSLPKVAELVGKQSQVCWALLSRLWGKGLEGTVARQVKRWPAMSAIELEEVPAAREAAWKARVLPRGKRQARENSR